MTTNSPTSAQIMSAVEAVDSARVALEERVELLEAKIAALEGNATSPKGVDSMGLPRVINP